MILTVQICAILSTIALIYLAVMFTLTIREGDKRIATVLEAMGEVKQTFLESDESFKNLINELHDLENLQQIRLLGEQVAERLTNAHDRIDSQVELSGKIIGQLHELVATWSKEGSELQRSYKSLAGAVEKAVVVEMDRATLMNAQLQELLTAHSAAGKA